MELFFCFSGFLLVGPLHMTSPSDALNHMTSGQRSGPLRATCWGRAADDWTKNTSRGFSECKRSGKERGGFWFLAPGALLWKIVANIQHLCWKCYIGNLFGKQHRPRIFHHRPDTSLEVHRWLVVSTCLPSCVGPQGRSALTLLQFTENTAWRGKPVAPTNTFTVEFADHVVLFLESMVAPAWLCISKVNICRVDVKSYRLGSIRKHSDILVQWQQLYYFN